MSRVCLTAAWQFPGHVNRKSRSPKRAPSRLVKLVKTVYLSKTMLPTPSTSHVCFDTIYEPAEDSYLFLDTLSSSPEATWLSQRFSSGSEQSPSPGGNSTPLVVEVGTGSGVVLAFAAANAKSIFGRPDVLTLGTDVNTNACSATRKTVLVALDEKKEESKINGREPTTNAQLCAAITGDLCAPLRPGAVDILLFNPPYVPTPELPQIPSPDEAQDSKGFSSKFERDSHLLSLSYAGGDNGMETTNRLLAAVPGILNPERGVAYVLLCAQNKPQDVMEHIRRWGCGWNVEIAGRSGVKAGWERLVIIRIWKDAVAQEQ